MFLPKVINLELRELPAFDPKAALVASVLRPPQPAEQQPLAGTKGSSLIDASKIEAVSNLPGAGRFQGLINEQAGAASQALAANPSVAVSSLVSHADLGLHSRPSSTASNAISSKLGTNPGLAYFPPGFIGPLPRNAAIRAGEAKIVVADPSVDPKSGIGHPVTASVPTQSATRSSTSAIRPYSMAPTSSSIAASEISVGATGRAAPPAVNAPGNINGFGGLGGSGSALGGGSPQSFGSGLGSASASGSGSGSGNPGPDVAGEVTFIGEDDGSTVTNTISYTPSGASGGTYDNTLTYSYGDGANGGSGTIEYNITGTSGGITFTLIMSFQDSYDQTVSITGPSVIGSLTDSGTDSLNLDDQVTYNSDGTAFDTFSSDTKFGDQFNLNLSGTDSYGGSFNVSDSGDDSSKSTDVGGDSVDGSGTDAYTGNNNSNDTRTFSDSLANGGTASDSQTDKLTYTDNGNSTRARAARTPPLPTRERGPTRGPTRPTIQAPARPRAART